MQWLLLCPFRNIVIHGHNLKCQGHVALEVTKWKTSWRVMHVPKMNSAFVILEGDHWYPQCWLCVWNYDSFCVCKSFGLILGASMLDDVWPYKDFYILSGARHLWKLVSSSMDVSMGLSLAAISTQSIAATSSQVWLFSKELMSYTHPSCTIPLK